MSYNLTIEDDAFRGQFRPRSHILNAGCSQPGVGLKQAGAAPMSQPSGSGAEITEMSPTAYPPIRTGQEYSFRYVVSHSQETRSADTDSIYTYLPAPKGVSCKPFSPLSKPS